jgi:hypothetical protein
MPNSAGATLPDFTSVTVTRSRREGTGARDDEEEGGKEDDAEQREAGAAGGEVCFHVVTLWLRPNVFIRHAGVKLCGPLCDFGYTGKSQSARDGVRRCFIAA